MNEALTRKQRKAKHLVADVLKLLERNRLPNLDYNCGLTLSDQLFTQLQPFKQEHARLHLHKIYPDSKTCLLGACAIAYIKRADVFCIAQLLAIGPGPVAWQSTIKAIFGRKRLQMMQVAYEEGLGTFDTYSPILNLTNLEYESAKKFCLGEAHTSRLSRIMSNAFANEGIFRPPLVECADPYDKVGTHTKAGAVVLSPAPEDPTLCTVEMKVCTECGRELQTTGACPYCVR